ncbi:MAG: hypothetical protein IT494_07435 [Gammaproteobacteria bacterium]|nr:hypothetical protein [Gammaproteobacteria bacterium]
MTRTSLPAPVSALNIPATASVFGEITGLDKSAVSHLRARGVLGSGETLHQWLRALIRHRGELAAGRSGGLAAERERVARAQAEKIERENAVRAGLLVPAEQLTAALADVAAQAVPLIEALPGRIRLRAPQTPVAALKVIEHELIGVRNAWAAIQPRELPPIAAAAPPGTRA